MSKLDKYLYKFSRNNKNIYLYKIAYHMVKNNSNSNCQVGGLKPDDTESLIKFLENLAKSVTVKTEKKYVVILFGPPASGKSIAKHIAYNIIKEKFDEKESYDNISKSFIDTNIDDITYSVETNNTTVEQLLKDNISKVLPDLENKPEKRQKELVKHKITELVKTSFGIYQSNRKRVDIVSELLYYFSIFLGKNTFIETSSGDPEYIGKIISSFNFYNYIPILVYPFTQDVNTLYERSISRGIKQGRFLLCDGPYGLAKLMTICLENYKKIKQLFDSRQYYCFIQYQSEFTDDMKDKLEKDDFTGLHDIILEIEYRKLSDAGNNTELVTHYTKKKNYSELTQLKTDCK